MSHHSNAFCRGCTTPEGISSLRSLQLPFLTISPSPTTRETAKGDVVSSDRSLMLGGRSHFLFDAPSPEKQHGISWLVLMNQNIPVHLALNARSHLFKGSCLVSQPSWTVSWPSASLALSRLCGAVSLFNMGGSSRNALQTSSHQGTTPAKEKVLPLAPSQDSTGAQPYRPYGDSATMGFFAA